MPRRRRPASGCAPTIRRSRSASPRRSAAPARPARSASSPGSSTPATPPIQGVKFFVNGTAVGQDADGPVYAVDWVDDNPFAPTVITVEVADAKGRTATGRVDLAAVRVRRAGRGDQRAGRGDRARQDRPADRRPRQGRLRPRGRRRAAGAGGGAARVVPATYMMLVDSSQSIAHGVGFLRDAVTRFMRYLRPDDRVLVVPFSRTLGAATGPTNDVETVLDAMLAVRPGGGTAIYDALVDTSEMIRRREGRHVLVLLTDGYDEHSVATRDDAIHAVQTLGRDRLRDRRRRRRRHLAEGRGAAQELRRGDRRPGVLPVSRERAAGGPRSRRVRRRDPLRADLHADQPARRRIVAGHPAGHRGPGAGRAHQAGLLRARSRRRCARRSS